MMYRQFLVLALALIASSACGPNRAAKISVMSAAELKQVSDKELCVSQVEETPQVLSERRERSLGDCSKEHMTCASSGYELGTELYLKCRMYLVQEKEIKRKKRRDVNNAMMMLGLSLMQSGQPVARSTTPETTYYTFRGQPLTCTRTGNVVNCF